MLRPRKSHSGEELYKLASLNPDEYKLKDLDFLVSEYIEYTNVCRPHNCKTFTRWLETEI